MIDLKERVTSKILKFADDTINVLHNLREMMVIRRSRVFSQSQSSIHVSRSVYCRSVYTRHQRDSYGVY